MEGSISSFCKTLTSFCKHIESSSQALRDSVDRSPIPLDSAALTFMQGLNRRVSSASSDLNLLESMVLGTVSFEELLGHCNEAFKKNHSDLLLLQDRLESFGYNSDTKMDAEDVVSDLASCCDVHLEFLNVEDESNSPSSACELVSQKLKEDVLLDDSSSIEDLGFSDVCPATLASDAKDILGSLKMTAQNSISKPCEKTTKQQPPFEDLGMEESINRPLLTSSNLLPRQVADEQKPDRVATEVMLKISMDEYDKLPPYLKSLVTWEDLQAAVVKINSILSERLNLEGGISLNQDDITLLELGAKGKSVLLILLRTNKLLVETVDGSIIYLLK